MIKRPFNTNKAKSHFIRSNSCSFSSIWETLPVHGLRQILEHALVSFSKLSSGCNWRTESWSTLKVGLAIERKASQLVQRNILICTDENPWKGREAYSFAKIASHFLAPLLAPLSCATYRLGIWLTIGIFRLCKFSMIASVACFMSALVAYSFTVFPLFKWNSMK